VGEGKLTWNFCYKN